MLGLGVSVRLRFSFIVKKMQKRITFITKRFKMAKIGKLCETNAKIMIKRCKTCQFVKISEENVLTYIFC